MQVGTAQLVELTAALGWLESFHLLARESEAPAYVPLAPSTCPNWSEREGERNSPAGLLRTARFTWKTLDTYREESDYHCAKIFNNTLRISHEKSK